MLTVVRRSQGQRLQPAPGFFELAGILRRDTSDILRCWVELR
jgi:hypothetical protein